MPQKQFSIYQEVSVPSATTVKHLLIEAGNQHFACIVKDVNSKSITAFELFNFSINEAENFENVMDFIETNSNVLSETFSNVDLIINSEKAVLIPSFKFTKDISEDYLQIAFGDGIGYEMYFNSINTDPVIMNAFRVKSDWMQILNRHFSFNQVRHIYTSIVKDAYLKAKNTENLFVQFYNQHIIVCAVKEQKLLLIQTFYYETSEDILYHLLNVSRQLNYSGSDLVLHISGLINLKSNLFGELEKYFQNVMVDTLESCHLIKDDEAYPSHYFTPFCKIAL